MNNSTFEKEKHARHNSSSFPGKIVSLHFGRDSFFFMDSSEYSATMELADRRKRSHEEQLGGDDTINMAKRAKKPTSHQQSSSVQTDSQNDKKGHLNIPGLIYIPNFITKSEEAELIRNIDSFEWDSTLKRRVQHYGFRYDYSSKSIKLGDPIDPLPSFMDQVLSKLDQSKYFPKTPDQCIINEYEPGQGISAHVDRVDDFGPVIASLSLSSHAIMSFTLGSEVKDVLLEPRSLVVLADDSRFKWKHSIAPRKSDVWNGTCIQRTRRVSMTFRTVQQRKSSS